MRVRKRESKHTKESRNEQKRARASMRVRAREREGIFLYLKPHFTLTYSYVPPLHSFCHSLPPTDSHRYSRTVSRYDKQMSTSIFTVGTARLLQIVLDQEKIDRLKADVENLKAQ